MTPLVSKKKYSTQRRKLKKIYQFDEEERGDAIIAVKRISQLAIRNTLSNSASSMVIDLLEGTSDEQEPNLFSMSLNSEYSDSSSYVQEMTMYHAPSVGPIEENENISTSNRSQDDRSDLISISSERPNSIFAGIRKRKGKHASLSPELINEKRIGKNLTSIPGKWMCGVCGLCQDSYEEARRHEDYHVREIVADLEWSNTSLGLDYNFCATGNKNPTLQALSGKDISLDEPQADEHKRQQNFVCIDDQLRNTRPSLASSQKPCFVTDSGSKTAISRPDLLTVSSCIRMSSSQNFSSHSHLSSYKINDLNYNPGLDQIQEYQKLYKDNTNLIPDDTKDHVILADEALTDVCCKAHRLALSQLEQEAEFELQCYSKDKRYYDTLENREIKRERDGAYSRFRTEGKNLAEKIQNKFVDAYAVMKQGKSQKTTTSVDHYKRKIEGDPDVQNVMDNTEHTIYVNVIVKNSIQVVNHELDRLARQRWEERKKHERGTDVRNEESRAQFEKFKAVAQGQLVQLAGLALASDFTPRRIAVQLSNDLFRLLTPRLKRRGVFIESEIEYRVGPYFVLAVNVLSVNWSQLVKMTHRDVADRRAKWIKTAECDDGKDGVTRNYGLLANLMGLFKMTSIEILAGVLAALYHTHWIVYTPVCWFLNRFLIGKIFRNYFLSSVTDEIFYFVEQKGMEMDIQIHDAETQAACMLSALQEIRADSRALKKKQKKAGSIEEMDLLGPMLGPTIKIDAKLATSAPHGFEVPNNLEFISLELNLQVGFRRLRWALLSSKSSFIRDVVWKAELNYDNIKTNEWNKFNDEIGEPYLNGPTQEGFVGATKETSYLMPKSAFVAANMAHEIAFIEAYNDYCFSLKLRALTPDVPYGSTFEVWTKYVVINGGNCSCELTCSVEAVFPNGPPMISRQIKSGMRDGVGKVFVKTGEAIQRYASAYP